MDVTEARRLVLQYGEACSGERHADAAEYGTKLVELLKQVEDPPDPRLSLRFEPLVDALVEAVREFPDNDGGEWPPDVQVLRIEVKRRRIDAGRLPFADAMTVLDVLDGVLTEADVDRMVAAWTED